MSATGRDARRRLQAGAVLLLLLCTLGLAVHFIAEGLPAAPAGSACGCEAEGDPADPAHEHGEDACLPTSLSSLPTDRSEIPVLKDRANGGASLSLLPQLPPPNP